MFVIFNKTSSLKLFLAVLQHFLKISFLSVNKSGFLTYSADRIAMYTGVYATHRIPNTMGTKTSGRSVPSFPVGGLGGGALYVMHFPANLLAINFNGNPRSTYRSKFDIRRVDSPTLRTKSLYDW